MVSGCIDPHFLDLGTSWRWVVNFTPRPLYPRGKSPRYSLDRRLRGPSGPVWTIWRRENSWPYRKSNSDPSVVQPVASRYTDWAIPVPKFCDICSSKWKTEVRIFLWNLRKAMQDFTVSHSRRRQFSMSQQSRIRGKVRRNFVYVASDLLDFILNVMFMFCFV
jgi:hypothetical protein